MKTGVDAYLAQGCGRCPNYNTPACKVHHWQAELRHLRRLLLASGLTETVKWSQPCYTLDGKNVVLMSAFKHYCSLSFFKGSLMKDPDGVLVSPGESSQATRQIRITDGNDITRLEPVIKKYLQEAIKIEQAGLSVKFKQQPEAVPQELQNRFDKNPAFKKAFAALTPGRQRGYILHFSSAKQAKTREARIDKALPNILAGKGMND